MKRSENHRGRTYETPDGKRYPSVTTILSVIGKPALINWAAKVERTACLEAAANLYLDVCGTPAMSRMAFITTLDKRLGQQREHQKQLEKAGDIGSQIHSLIEWELRAKMLEQPGPSPHVTDTAMQSFVAWQQWAKNVNLRPIHIEQQVWSNSYEYAGTMDLYAEIDGVETVLDWKSGKAVYPEAHLQNAAYRRAIREMGHGDPRRGLIVRVPKNEKDPKFEVVEAWDECESFEVFLQAKTLWKWTQEKDKYLAAMDEQEATAAA